MIRFKTENIHHPKRIVLKSDAESVSLMKESIEKLDEALSLIKTAGRIHRDNISRDKETAKHLSEEQGAMRMKNNLNRQYNKKH